MALPDLVQLQEWGTVELPLSEAQVAALLAHPEKPVSIEVGSRAGSWVVRAAAKVGVAQVGGLELRITPKAGMDTVFHMLGVTRVREWWGAAGPSAHESDDLLSGAIVLFARALDVAIRGGLVHGYVHRQERLVALRGRVDFAAQMRRPALPFPIAARFDDYTSDVPLNQVLKAALLRVLPSPSVPARSRMSLVRSLANLDDVSSVVPDLDELDSWEPSRLDEHYEPAVRLAQLLLRNLAITEAEGEQIGYTFLVDMNFLFEVFVEEALRRHLHRLAPDLVLERHPTVHLGVGGRVGMYPDLLVRRGRQKQLVADTKYVLRRGVEPPVDHYTQVLAYATACSVPHAMLIYPRSLVSSAEEVPPLRVRGADVRIHTSTVDLAGSVDEVDEEMAELARLVASLVEQAPQRLAG